MRNRSLEKTILEISKRNKSKVSLFGIGWFAENSQRKHLCVRSLETILKLILILWIITNISGRTYCKIIARGSKPLLFNQPSKQYGVLAHFIKDTQVVFDYTGASDITTFFRRDSGISGCSRNSKYFYLCEIYTCILPSQLFHTWYCKCLHTPNLRGCN